MYISSVIFVNLFWDEKIVKNLFLVLMWLCSEVDLIVVLFFGGVVGVILLFMVVEINNVK